MCVKLGRRRRKKKKKKKEKGKEKKTKKTYPHTKIERQKLLGQELWFMLVIPALWEAEVGGSQGQEFETSLTNMVKSCLY